LPEDIDEEYVRSTNLVHT